MFLSNPAKSFLAGLFVWIAAAGCGFVGTGDNTATSAIEAPESRLPFKTKEPENFQCEIVETAGETVRRKRLAKKGTWRRIDFDLGETTQRALLQTDNSYVIDINRGIYAEHAPGAGGQFSEITHELLTTPPHGRFEEMARDGAMVRFIVRPAESNASEIVVHYDESIGLPVKQEFFSIAGEARALQFTVEMVGFKAMPEADLFTLPPGFRKTSMNVLISQANR